MVERIKISLILGILFMLMNGGLVFAQLEDLADGDVIQNHLDIVRNFGKDYTIKSVKSGLWSDPSVWSTGSIPGNGDVVRISKNTIVTYDVSNDNKLNTVGINGILKFDVNKKTKIRVTNLMVYPAGTLEIGTEQNPMKPNSEARVIFNDIAPDTGVVGNEGFDPEQYGTGLLSFGKVVIYGEKKSPAIRSSEDLLFGEDTITLKSIPIGWKVGDKLLVPDTRDFLASKNDLKVLDYNNLEIVEIKSISNNIITLKNQLQFNHYAAKNATADRGIRFTPYIHNLNRNVIFESENPNGVKAHTQTYARSDWKVYYAKFLGLGRTKVGTQDSSIMEINTIHPFSNSPIRLHESAGVLTGPDNDLDLGGSKKYSAVLHAGKIKFIQSDRKTGEVIEERFAENARIFTKNDYELVHVGTNQIARYPVHFHHVMGPMNPSNTGYQFEHVGTVIEGSDKWGTSIHGSSYGLYKDNIIYDTDHWGFVTEDGSEYKNEIDGNFVVASDDSCYWFNMPMNIIKNNVATNCNGRGYYIEGNPGNARFKKTVPIKRGTMLSDPLNTEIIETRYTSFIEFNNNEVYSSEGGIAFYGIGDKYSKDFGNPNAEDVIVKNFKGWHLSDSVVTPYHSSAGNYPYFYMENPIFIADIGVSRKDLPTANHIGSFIRFSGGTGITIRNADIQGYTIGFHDRSRQDSFEVIIEDSFFANRNNYLNIPWHQGIGKLVTFRNTIFAETIEPDNRQVYMDWKILEGNVADISPVVHTSIFETEATIFINHNGIQGNDFRAYWDTQAPNVIIPDHKDSKLGGPVPCAGITNQECFNQFGKALAGAVIPSTATTSPDVVGGMIADLGDVTPPQQLCGNGNVDPGESCDDGNKINGDGCSASCQIENNGTCIDFDNDGYFAEGGACGVIDCKDDDFSINPGQTEICDSVDNNCDGTIDEGCECLSGDFRVCGSSDLGICNLGNQTCVNGIWGDCQGNIEPVFELCDGLDNDCNGVVDNQCGICNGCLHEANCLPIGFRISISENQLYCEFGGNFLSQKGPESSCQNDFECKSNQCSNGNCIDTEKQEETSNFIRDMIIKVWCWITNPIDGNEYDQCVLSFN